MPSNHGGTHQCRTIAISHSSEGSMSASLGKVTSHLSPRERLRNSSGSCIGCVGKSQY
ncbi:hypothetical protein HMPREF9622_00697 [Cutibacterium modestum HL037PA3]|uniref:Uncharacterized protein n=1 Tax=Cutibacterium modestum HL044PA1 TaxID=765109 RepID=A0ABP2K4Z0_9ACTN|nr:hypothetical protein HMPREF9621_01272 [Cutibacterium modestum HL037PA2]EFS91979.1 hypothetical protein HMPREF9607_01845 [Cutibacterium modestum HL044PA1]EFT16243.1 hypothetical protein HMPREF9622_00697 [Cutibacterium modestum HL037PA3]